MKNSKQMELNLSTSSQVAIPASRSVSLDLKKVLKIRDTSGQNILDLSKNVGQLGLLEKMLVDTLNSVWTPYNRTWKVKATLLERLVFQLLASVPRTKEKESGLWQTPTAVGINQRSQEALERKMKKRLAMGRTTVPPGSLQEQIKFSPNKEKPRWNMWRTPDAAAGGSNLPGIKKALDEGHLKRPSGQQIQIRLQDQVQEPRLWPTPVHSDHLMNKSETLEAWKIRAKKKKEENGVNLQYALRHAVQEEKPGGTLSPNWVEWLMGYPTGHTDLKR